MDQCHAAVAKIEYDRILVFVPARADDVSGVVVEDEPINFINEAIEPNLPWLAVARIGEMCIGHNNVFFTVAMNSLDPRIFVREHCVGRTSSQYLLEFVVEPVGRGKHQDIRDVIDEAGPGIAVAPATVADTSREQMEDPVMVNDPGVEDCPVTGNRVRSNDRFLAYST